MSSAPEAPESGASGPFVARFKISPECRSAGCVGTSRSPTRTHMGKAWETQHTLHNTAFPQVSPAMLQETGTVDSFKPAPTPAVNRPDSRGEQ